MQKLLRELFGGRLGSLYYFLAHLIFAIIVLIVLFIVGGGIKKIKQKI